jgi:hypothetical protein
MTSCSTFVNSPAWEHRSIMDPGGTFRSCGHYQPSFIIHRRWLDWLTSIRSDNLSANSSRR